MNDLLIALLFFIEVNTSITTAHYTPPAVITSVKFNGHIEDSQTNQEPKGKVMGLYAYDEASIYLSKNVDLNTTYGKSILLHELVHHLQHSLEDQDDHCLNKLERDAYQIQNMYLQSRGSLRIIPQEHIDNMATISAECH